MLTRRSIVAAAGVAPLALSGTALAQSRPSSQQLQRLIARALQAEKTVRFARPEPLGFVNVAVVTRQLGTTAGSMEYYLAVTEPRLKDGLIFFSNEPATRTFRMHRTDTHLLRVASATNDLKLGNQGLAAWDGPSADNDFNAQLAYWATVG
jgi:hypothetical protein